MSTPAYDQKLEEALKKRPWIAAVILLAVLGGVGFALFLGARHVRSWWYEQFPPPATGMATEAAESRGYEVLSAKCLRWPPNDGLAGIGGPACTCSDTEHFTVAVGLMVRDREGGIMPVFVHCRSCDPDACDVRPEDWTSWK